MPMEMTFIDFFSGIGGFRAGLEACGMRCIGHCEIDKFADQSYRAIFDVKEDEWFAKDITAVKPEEIPRADIWTAGFPCQDISVAGSQRGLNGKRSGLFFEVVRLIQGKMPKINPNGLSLKMLKICYPLIEDGTLQPFSIRWPHSAMIVSTDFLIHAITESHKIENGSTLSLIDILETKVPEKYFLSPEATEKLLSNS